MIPRDPEDPQQFLLYRMEREEIGCRAYARLSLTKARLVARSVCRTYGVPQARIIVKKAGRWAAIWDNGLITLNPDNGAATDLLTILHELAHHIHYYLGHDWGSEDAAHGPEFMACYLSILDTVRLIPYDAMATICRRRKLKFLIPGPSVTSLRQVLRTKTVRRHGAQSSRPTPRR
jgi:hypothetical protein